MRTERKDGPQSFVQIIACTSEQFHPYECDGPGKCRYCDAERTQPRLGEESK